jgi:hypothetical protein
MIKPSLELIRRRLNSFLATGDPTADNWVVLANLVDHEGRPFGGAENKLVMFVGNVEYDSTIGTPGRTMQRSGAAYTAVTAPRYINVWVVFWANFMNERYPDGLDMLSRTISFFQQYPVFTHDSDPQLDAGVARLSMEMMNLDLTQLNYLTSMTGAKYLPMVCYRMRMLPFTSEAVQAVVPVVRATGTPDENVER